MCSMSERNSINNGRTIGASIPTLHVVANKTGLYRQALTTLMCKDFGEKAVLIEHEKGHVIPKVLPPNEIGRKLRSFSTNVLWKRIVTRVCSSRFRSVVALGILLIYLFHSYLLRTNSTDSAI